MRKKDSRYQPQASTNTCTFLCIHTHADMPTHMHDHHRCIHSVFFFEKKKTMIKNLNFNEQAVSMSENTAGFVWMDFQYKPLILISHIYIVLFA